MLLESNLLHLEDLKKLSWSGVPVEVRPMTWRLLAVSWSIYLQLIINCCVIMNYVNQF